ncbi:unnamed protein product [Mytilus edulis]|uniref:Uncharacterized protein n=1 Tax=Mytilus edulis TaxID=6550 RepID=A0A8S3UDU0_MYTED|nr:unnamed protein product [Mytilus edulis]
MDILGHGKISPIKFQVQTNIEDLKPSTLRYLKRKATTTVHEALDCIAPSQAKKLLQLLHIDKEPSRRTELSTTEDIKLQQLIIQLYNESSDRNAKIQLLSMVSDLSSKKHCRTLFQGSHSMLLTQPDNMLLNMEKPSKNYSVYPTPRQPSRSRNSKEDRPETPIVGISAHGPSHELQDKLVEFITKDQPINRSTPFCKYLETELDRLHDACLDPAYEEITTVLNHDRKVSRRYKTREAAGDKVGPSEEVPSTFQSQENTAQQRPIATYQRVNQIQQDSGISCNSFYLTSRSSSPSPEIQPAPRHWPMNPPPGSVWQSQDCGYMEQANRQYNQEQFQTLQPATKHIRVIKHFRELNVRCCNCQFVFVYHYN